MKKRRVLMVVAVVIAMLGAGLVFVYAQAAESRAAQKFTTVQVLVATQKINPGETADAAISQGKATLVAVPQAQVLPGATAQTELFTDQVALTAIYPNEQLIPDKFGSADEVEAAETLPIPKGKIAISIALDDPRRVAGFARPGSKVAVFVVIAGSGTTGTGAGVTDLSGTQVLLDEVLILGIGSATQMVAPEGDAAAVEALPNTLITLAVTQEEAQKVLTAQNAGSLTFALLSDSSKVEVGDPFFVGKTDPPPTEQE